MDLKDIKFDTKNYRKHSDEKKALIKKSIQETGLGRSVVIDSENELIAGNGVVSQLPEGTPIRVIETDGSELVVVKRTDLKTKDEKRKKLALMDNSASEFYGIEHPLGGGTMHGKDLSKADCSVNIYCFLKAQELKAPLKAICSIGDKDVLINGQLVPFAEIVETAREYINKIGGFEQLAKWGLY